MEFFSIISIQISEMLRFCRFYMLFMRMPYRLASLTILMLNMTFFLSENKWTER